MVEFIGRTPGFDYEMLGMIPAMLSEHNPESAKEQLDRAYSYGGGWRPFEGFRMRESGDLVYPGDPDVRLIAEARLRDEVIRVYDMSWIAIIQPDGSFEVSRMD